MQGWLRQGFRSDLPKQERAQHRSHPRPGPRARRTPARWPGPLGDDGRWYIRKTVSVAGKHHVVSVKRLIINQSAWIRREWSHCIPMVVLLAPVTFQNPNLGSVWDYTAIYRCYSPLFQLISPQSIPSNQVPSYQWFVKSPLLLAISHVFHIFRAHLIFPATIPTRFSHHKWP